ncbi:MAG: helix-turn-helix domain-containing protein [Halothiobacillaceae bacterium]|jgi:Fis family transcriptional regulator|nr:helix-turn-helix domain-containing protein [Halothiobacillaceae bacterium]
MNSAAQRPAPSAADTSGTPPMPLHAAVSQALRHYLDTLEGEMPSNLYELVIREVERPLLEIVMQRCDGNQSRASQALGINRGTLRKKLREHALGEDI